MLASVVSRKKEPAAMEKGAWLAELAGCMVLVLLQVGISGPDRT
jgi:hypothetical protein